MTQTDRENLQNKQLTDSLIIECLAVCEAVISRNAYLEKKWKHHYGEGYTAIRLQWMTYREKLRGLLLDKYSMKQIIQMTKGSPKKATKKAVEEVINLIDSRDYTLCP